MGVRDTKSLSALGFLTVVEHEQLGLFGGYLVLNAGGRPLEFHCTAPIKPNRAQQILYGATLEPYLYGEQIGQTLVTKAETKPGLVCTDLPAVLAVREHVELPVALVLPPSPGDGTALRFDEAHALREPASFTVGRNRLSVSWRHSGDRSEVASQLAALDDGFDLAEPFARIREAIEEAQRSGR